MIYNIDKYDISKMQKRNKINYLLNKKKGTH